MPPRSELAPSTMDAAEQAEFEASVKQGLAELDAGLYVSGPEVEAWAKSLFSKTRVPIPAIRQRVRF